MYLGVGTVVGLIADINRMIDNINKYCDICLSLDNDNIESATVNLIGSVTTVIPSIISLYDNAESGLDSQGKLYWVSQLKRMSNALESKDAFEKWDVFKNESVDALNQIKSYLEEK